jgi:hypothetical protein
MIRNAFGTIARWVIPTAILLLAGASAGNAAPLSPAGLIDRAADDAGALVHQVGEGNQLRAERQLLRRDLRGRRSGLRRDGRRVRRDGRRHRRDGRRHRSYRRHRSNGGVYFGIYPFVPNYYGYGYSRPRYSGGSCSYWSDRCIENWGYGNSNYYGCLRYHGC